jgi:hypothetical protein
METLVQPYFAVLFFSAGCAGYVIYEFLRSFSAKKFFAPIADLLSAMLACGIFLAVTHLFYDGQIKWYTLFCFFCGAIILRLLLKDQLRRSAQVFNAKLSVLFKKALAKTHKKLSAMQAKIKGVFKNGRGTKETNDKRRRRHTKNQTKKSHGRGNRARRDRRWHARPNGTVARGVQKRHRRHAKHRNSASDGKGQGAEKHTLPSIQQL